MIGRTYLEAGSPVRVLIRWGRTGAGSEAPIGKLDGSGWGRRRAPHNVLIERQDGSRVVRRPFRWLRKLPEVSRVVRRPFRGLRKLPEVSRGL